MTGTSISTRPQSRGKQALTQLRTRGWLSSLLIAVAWQAGLTILGRLIQSGRGVTPGLPFFDDLLGHTVDWDGQWYLRILENGYASDPSNAAFYPMFPLLVWIGQVATLGLLSPVTVGFVINTVAIAAALQGLKEICKHFDFAPAQVRLVLALFLTAPPAIFMHMFYTEALFLAFGIWAYVFALRGRWMLMAPMLAMTTATRLTGVLVLALCGLEYLRAHDWKMSRALRWQILTVPAGLLGFAGYALACRVIYGDPLAMINNVRASDQWTYHVFEPNILITLADEVRAVARAAAGLDGGLYHRVLFESLFPLIALAVLLAASIYLLVKTDRKALPLGVFGILAFVMFTLNSNIISVHRYVFACFSLYIAAGLLLKRHPRLAPVAFGLIYLGSLLQGWWFYLWFEDSFLVS